MRTYLVRGLDYSTGTFTFEVHAMPSMREALIAFTRKWDRLTRVDVLSQWDRYAKQLGAEETEVLEVKLSQAHILVTLIRIL